MKRSSTIFTLVAVATLILQGAACDGSNPLAPDAPGGTDLPGPGTSFHQSGATIESASLSNADPTQMTIVLGGDVQIRVTGETVIDAGGDLTTLDQVLSAIDAGIPIRIEVDGTLVDGVVNATHIRFETDGSSSSGGNGSGGGGDDGISQDEVHGIVAAVDLGARTVTLADGRTLRVGTDAQIEADGDFRTLAEVVAALAAGLEVRVEADLAPATGGVREVRSAKFESDQADGPGGRDDGDDVGDDDGDDLDEVHGIVAGVDLGARIVTLADGRVLRVDSDARIETDGDFRTLAEVAAALAAGLEVRVEADLAPATGAIRDVTSVKFESDEDDGPGDDDGDGNSGSGNGGGDDNSGPGNGGDDNSGPGNDGGDNSGPGNGGGDDFGDDEVEGIVAFVDLAARTVTTTSGRVIRVATDALIEADGDILTLAQVAQRLATGATIRVEADGVTEGSVFVATQAKFEVD